MLMKIKKIKISKTVCLLLSIIMIAVSVNVFVNISHADVVTSDLPIDKEHFPDDGFRGYVEKYFDDNQDGVLSQGEIANVKYLEEANLVNMPIKEIYDYTGIEYFYNLEHFVSTGANLKKLDLSKNTKLTFLKCWSKNISYIDVSNKSDLKEIDVSGSGLTNIDVQNNVNLRKLNCGSTKINNLDLSNNTKLEVLKCSNTQLNELNLSNNKSLRYLDISYTNIIGIDLTENDNLEALHRSDLYGGKYNPIAWINYDTLNFAKQEISITRASQFDIDVIGDSFDITKTFPGIDTNRINILSGGTLNGNVISGYKQGVPLIYKYYIGKTYYVGVEAPDYMNYLTVTLDLDIRQKSDSTINIYKELDKYYDGVKVVLTKDDCSISGSNGAVKFTYYTQHDDGSWEIMRDSPVVPGHYKVVAELAEDNSFNGASTEKEFNIFPSVATNENTKAKKSKAKLIIESDNSKNAGQAFVKTDDKVSVELLVLMLAVAVFTLIKLLKKRER